MFAMSITLGTNCNLYNCEQNDIKKFKNKLIYYLNTIVIVFRIETWLSEFNTNFYKIFAISNMQDFPGYCQNIGLVKTVFLKQFQQNFTKRWTKNVFFKQIPYSRNFNIEISHK